MFDAFIDYPASPAEPEEAQADDVQQTRGLKGKQRAVTPEDHGETAASEDELSDHEEWPGQDEAVQASLYPDVPPTPLGRYQDPGAPGASGYGEATPWPETPAFSGGDATPASVPRPATPVGLKASLVALGTRRKSVVDLASKITFEAIRKKQGPTSGLTVENFKRGLEDLNKKDDRPEIDIEEAVKLLRKENRNYFAPNAKEAFHASLATASEKAGIPPDQLAALRVKTYLAKAAEKEGKTPNQLHQERHKASLARVAQNQEKTPKQLRAERSRTYLAKAAEKQGKTTAQLSTERRNASVVRSAQRQGITAKQLNTERKRASLVKVAEKEGKTPAQLSTERRNAYRKQWQDNSEA